jgi:hypothetical protein
VSIHDYWAMYDRTLARVRDEKPSTFAALKAILDRFNPPSSADAFFPDGADDTLADALRSAGWVLKFFGADYVYKAKHPLTRACLHYIEGDLHDRTRLGPSHVGARVALVQTKDEHSRLEPNATGTVEAVDDAGTVHVLWDNGTRLGLIPGADVWRALHPRWDSNPMTSSAVICTRCGKTLAPGCCDATEETDR